MCYNNKKKKSYIFLPRVIVVSPVHRLSANNEINHTKPITWFISIRVFLNFYLIRVKRTRQNDFYVITGRSDWHPCVFVRLVHVRLVFLLSWHGLRFDIIFSSSRSYGGRSHGGRRYGILENKKSKNIIRIYLEKSCLNYSSSAVKTATGK